MANKPPSGSPPPLPPFDSYRPIDERTGPPAQGRPQHGGAAGARPQHPGAQQSQRQPANQTPPGSGPTQRIPQQPYGGQPPYPGQPSYGQQPQQHYGPGQQPYSQGQQPYGYGQQPPRTPPPQPMRGGGPPRRPPAKSAGLLKGLLFGLVALLAFAVAGAAYFVMNAPADLVRDRIVAEVKAKTGRDLKIAGPATFTVYPNIGVSMSGVSLSPPPGMAGKPLVTMDSFDVSVRILPLLKREVYVERIILQKPVFELYTDKQGRKSWEFAALSSRPVQFAQAAPAPATGAPPTASDAAPVGAGSVPAPPAASAPPDSVKSASIEQLHFGNVRIDDGTVRYADAATGTAQEASAINMKVGLSDLRQPLSADGDLVWKGQKVGVDLTLTSLKAVMDDKPAKVALLISSAPATARFDGSLVLRDGYDAEGTLDAKSPSVRALAKWLGTELPAAKGYGPFDATGQLRATPKAISLSGAKITLDGATANGQVTVETAGARPYVKTTLSVSELDLNKYIGNGDGSAPVKPAASPTPAAAGDAATPKPPAQSIEDLLGDPPAAAGPRVQGYSKRTQDGWSTDPIDLTSLDAVDADAKLSVGRLLYQDLKVGQSQLTVALKNKVMKTNFDDIQLYGGRGQGFITLDGTSAKAASAGANLSFEGIDALPFLKDAADFDKLSGKAKLTLAVAGLGANQKQMMNTLNGKGDFTFANGAINGLNVAGMVRGVTQGKLSGLQTSPTEKTDFSELASTWTIVNGVASNQDLRLVSPLLRLTGAGNVMLASQQVDYIMKPKLVSSIAGQGGAGNEQGIEVPVRVHGPWSKPEYTPDLKGIFSDPNKAVDTLKEIGKQFKGQNAGDALKSILGGGKQPAQPASPGATTGTTQPAPKPTTKQLLDQFLNKPAQ